MNGKSQQRPRFTFSISSSTRARKKYNREGGKFIQKIVGDSSCLFYCYHIYTSRIHCRKKCLYRASRIIWHGWELAKVSYKPNVICHTGDFQYKKILFGLCIRCHIIRGALNLYLEIAFAGLRDWIETLYSLHEEAWSYYLVGRGAAIHDFGSWFCQSKKEKFSLLNLNSRSRAGRKTDVIWFGLVHNVSWIWQAC